MIFKHACRSRTVTYFTPGVALRQHDASADAGGGCMGLFSIFLETRIFESIEGRALCGRHGTASSLRLSETNMRRFILMACVVVYEKLAGWIVIEA
jgi:hypothetical protein